jgi:uncharacterized membrane protein YqjE
MGEYEQDQHTGIFASLRRMCDTTIATVHDRIELIAIEAREEKQRFIKLLMLTAVIVFLGNMTVLMLTVTILYFAGDHVRGPLLIAMTLAYGVGGLWGFLALRKKLATGPRLFDDTLAELKKDRDWLIHRK